MKGLYKYIFCLLFLALSVEAFTQFDDDEDEGFKTFKSKKEFSGKRKFNIHLEAGYSMSGAYGQEIEVTKDSLEARLKRYNLDSYNVDPIFFPYGKINASFNFTESFSLTFGLHYNRLGWKEIAKVDRSNLKYRYYNKLEFDYIGVPIAINFHIGKHFSFKLGQDYSFLVKNDIENYEYLIRNGIVRFDTKKRETFEDVLGFKSAPFILQTVFGVNAGTKRIRFSLNFSTTLNYIHILLPINSYAVEAGVIFKIFEDYD